MKSIAQVLLLGAIIVLGAVFAGESLLPEPYGMLNSSMQSYSLDEEVRIVGPDMVVVGELARMEVEGDIVKWDCIPHILDGQSYGENGKNFVASFREPGVYNVIAAVYTVGAEGGALDEDVRILHLPITVAGPPEPVEPPAPVSFIDLELAAEAFEWCDGAKRSDVKLLAGVFDTVAREIEAKELTTSGGIVNRTAQLNQQLNLSGLGALMSRIQNYLTLQADSGKLSTMEDHLTVWNSIARGLNQYAN